jgi:hypothetical protein
MLWWGERRGCLQGQRCDEGGSSGLNLLAYEPVKAWSTASWRVVDVVRREKRGRRVFRPRSSFSMAVAADHRGWFVSEGGWDITY